MWIRCLNLSSNGCHNLLMESMRISDIAILNIKGADYPCIICGISKSEAVHLLQNTDLNEKNGVIKIMKIIKTLKIYIKLDKKTIKFGNTEIVKHKIPILTNNVYFNKTVISNKVSFGKKGFKYFYWLQRW